MVLRSTPHLKFCIHCIKRQHAFLLVRKAVVLHCNEWPTYVGLRSASLYKPSVNVGGIGRSQKLVVKLCIDGVAMGPRHVMLRWSKYRETTRHRCIQWDSFRDVVPRACSTKVQVPVGRQLRGKFHVASPARGVCEHDVVFPDCHMWPALVFCVLDHSSMGPRYAGCWILVKNCWKNLNVIPMKTLRRNFCTK